MIEESFSPLPGYLFANAGKALPIAEICEHFQVGRERLQCWMDQLLRCGVKVSVTENILEISEPLDLILPEQLAALCSSHNHLARNIHYFFSVGSTSDLALSGIDDQPEGTLYVAERQSAGRGRGGRSWMGQPGKSLHFSWIAKPPDGAWLGLLPLTVGVGVIEGLKQAVPAATALELKWPNDVLLLGRKLGGILCEGVQSGGTIKGVIVGVGINVYPGQWSLGIGRPAVALAEAGAEIPRRAAILASILDSLDRWYAKYKQQDYEEIRDCWLRFCPMSQGRAVRWERIEGITRGLTPSGGLRLERKDGSIVEVMAGDVE